MIEYLTPFGWKHLTYPIDIKYAKELGWQTRDLTPNSKVNYKPIIMDEFKGTKGPWRWELNKKSKSLQLCGYGECGPYDFTVMDFERWGMGGAVPRFREGEQNLMIKAFEFGEIVPNRAHHADWFQSLNHPDAMLIAASPELLSALQLCINLLEDNYIDAEFSPTLEIAKKAISKALGGDINQTK